MSSLLQDHAGRRVFFMGNEGIVRGALEAGVEVATAYPGTPSSEIADNFYRLAGQTDLYFEYATNEKVALEVAAAAAIAGMRSMCSMKHVGLNVAADPLNTLSYTGVKAGMVIVTADDPSMHSSQNEQDNRYYAKLSLIPMVEPADPAEALAFTRKAFALSEQLQMPVLLRTTTRVNHSRGVCTLGELTPRRFVGHFDKDFRRWVPVPAVARGLRLKLIKKQEEAYSAMQKLGLDIKEGEGELGIITAGVAYAYVKEVLIELGMEGKVQLLKIGSIHPLPRRAIRDLLASTRRVLVVEELEPYLETEVRAMAQRAGVSTLIEGKGEGWIPREFELSGDRIREPVAKLFGMMLPPRPMPAVPELPGRPPMLCAGCSHRTSYYAVKSIAEPDTYFSSDIGCYTLGLLPPLSTTDSFLCMGSSVTMASGVSIRNSQPHVAFIGDSTFFHSGVNGLINAVHNRHDLLLMILDNSTTAMTGHQPHPGNARDEEKERPMDIEKLVFGLGIDDLHVVDPTDLKHTIETVRAAYQRKGVRVIISRKPCHLYARRLLGQRGERLIYRVDQDKCKRCGKIGRVDTGSCRVDCVDERRDATSTCGCGVPIHKDEEILRARTKLLAADLEPMAFPAQGRARKPESAPCTFACPANICVFGYLSLARAGRFASALALIREQVPLPLILGRVCHRPCEGSCVRGEYDGAIAINEVKRFVAELEGEAEREAHFKAEKAKAEAARADRAGAPPVAVIGAGPAGIAAAYDLTLRGYQVTLLEKEDVPGGLLTTGIPPYRLPRDLLQAELSGALSVGMELRTGQVLGRDFTVRELLDGEGYGAVCLALGAGLGMQLMVHGEQASGVEDALTFLRRVNLLDQRQVGARVMVVGGGDAAMDAARTAVRLGAEQVRILYRRSEQEMPASAEVIAAARAEGVELALLTVPVGFETDADGAVIAARVVECELGEPDASGRRRPVPMPETEAPLSTDHVILALGQRPDAAALAGDLELGQTNKGYIPAADKSGATADPRVFCAGDLTGQGWTVIAAMAQGKRAAHGIDLLLAGGAEVTPLALHTVDELPAEGRYKPAGVKAATRAVPAERAPGQRSADFEAVSAALTAGQVVDEAERCLSCGQCARCNNCIDNFGCPAIFKKDGKVYIDEVLCVGCGVCAQLCPNDAIEPGRAPTPEKS